MAEPNAENAIERMVNEHRELMDCLRFAGDTSLQIRTDAAFAKALLLSVASYFETRLTDEIEQVFLRGTNGSDALTSFVRKMAIERRYHQWFNWEASNANKFFSSFGTTFRQFMGERVRADSTLADSIKAFLQLGDLRNQLVHQNFAQFPVPLTAEEIFNRYREANLFVEGFLDDLQQYIGRETGNGC